MSEGYSPEVRKGSIACDSSALISLADCCFTSFLYELKGYLDGSFIIPKGVEDECINTPLKTKSHTLNAIRLQKALNDGVLVTVDSPEVERATNEILYLANTLFFLTGRPLSLLQRGETQTLAIAREFGLKNILIDERTTRMLIEAPYLLRDHMEEEFRKRVSVNEKKLERFEELTSGFNLFRSSELVIIGYEKGLFKSFGEMEKHALEAAMYGLKFAGCAISFDEINKFIATL